MAQFAYLAGGTKGSFARPYSVSRGSFGWSTSPTFSRPFSTAAPTLRTKAAPAVAPERFNFSAPFSSAPVASVGYKAPAAKEGPTDPIGSFQQAIADMIGGGQNMNLGNIPARFLEASDVLVRQFGDHYLKGTPLEPVASVGAGALDVLLGGYETLAGAIAPVLDAPLNIGRDNSLGERLRAYRDLANGQAPTGVTAPGMGAFVSGGNQSEWFTAVLEANRGNGDLARRTAMEAIDLPDSVKSMIRANPTLDDASLSKLLDGAPEGRQFSYQPDLGGMLRNIAPAAIYYIAGTIGGIRAGSALTGAMLGSTRTPAIPLAGAVLRRGASMAARIQGGAVGAGAGTIALATLGDAVARTQGNQALLDLSNEIFNTHPISDDPHVQVLSSLTINPFVGAGMLRRGIMRLPGVPDVVVGKVAGRKMSRLYSDSDLLYDRIRTMYGLSSRGQAQEWVGSWYRNKGEAFDHLVEIAADDVVARLPVAQRVALQHGFSDPIERAAHVLKTYGDSIMDTILNHPERLADRFQVTAWTYHGYRGTFVPEVAAKNALDMRVFKGQTYRARQEMGAVAGYVDVLHPTAISEIRESLEALPDGAVPDRWVNDFIEKFPALQKYAGQTIKPGQALTKADIEHGLVLAETDFGPIAKHNPVRAKTGADPILRPTATPREWADALGTDERIVQAVSEGPSPANADILRPFVKDKLGLDDAGVGALSPDEVWTKASDYIDNTTRPWVEAGTRIAQAEKEAERLTARWRELQTLMGEEARTPEAELLRRARAAHTSKASPVAEVRASAESEVERLSLLVEQARESAAIDRKMAALDQLLGEVRDPITPYSGRLAFAEREVKASRGRAALEEKAQRKVAAQAAIDELNAIEDEAQALTGGFGKPQPERVAAYQSAVRRAGKKAALSGKSADEIAAAQARVLDPTKELGGSWRGLIGKTDNGTWGWANGLPKPSAAIVGRLEDFLRGYGKAGVANTLHEMGNEDLWVVISQHYHPGSRFYKSLTATERTQIEKLMGGKPVTRTLDEVAASAGVTEDELVARLGQLAERYDELLDGNTPYEVRRTAEMVVPSDVITAINERTLVYDPLFEAVEHPKNLAQLRAALDEAESSGAMDTVSAITERDPILAAQVMEMADQVGRMPGDFATDPANIGVLRKLLGDEPVTPLGTAVARTPLDQAIIGGDLPGVAKLVDELGAIQGRLTPKPPIKGVAERDAAKAIDALNPRPVRTGSAKPPREFPEKMSPHDADRTKDAPVVYGYKKWHDWRGLLHREQFAAFDAYLDDAEAEVNEALRAGKPLPKWADPEMLKHMDEALDRSAIPEDVILWRGVEKGRIGKPRVGQVIHEKGYTSTSLSRDIAIQGYVGTGEGAYLVRIHARKGAKGGFIDREPALQKAGYQRAQTAAPQEAEVLLPRDTDLTVSGIHQEVDEFGNSLTVIDADYGAPAVVRAAPDEPLVANMTRAEYEAPFKTEDFGRDSGVHIAPGDTLDDIRRHGLVPGGDGRVYFWAGGDIDPPEMDLILEMQHDVRWAEKHPEAPTKRAIVEGAGGPGSLGEWLESSADFRANAVEVGIRPGVAKFHLDEHTPSGMAGYFTEPIPPEQLLVRVDHGTWQPLVPWSEAVRRSAPVEPPAPALPRPRGRAAARPSTQYLEKLDRSGVDLQAVPDEAILAAEENRIGREVLSLINRGIPGTSPRTIGGVVSLLKEIENGNATNMGLGPELLAKGQALANRLLDHAIHATAREGFVPGTFSKGADMRLMSEGELGYVRELLDRGDIVTDPLNPLGLQYGFKRPPKDAVTWEFEEARRIAEESGVPGLGEEFITGHFQPWEERLLGAKLRQAWNFVFGPLHNMDIAAHAETEFLRRTAALGVEPKDAAAIWKGWRQKASDSRSTQTLGKGTRLRGGKVVEEGKLATEKGDNPLYASPRNIPNSDLRETAQQILSDRYGKDPIPAHYVNIDFADAFRQSTSYILRTLEDSPFTLAQKLGAMYGAVTTNKFVTMTYYLWRFGLDIRFHAMNYLEPYFLYAGRAGLLPESRAGMKPYLGMTEEYLRNLSRDALNDTGYPFGLGRARWAYKSFSKEQPGRLLERLRGLQTEDPALMTRALEDMAKFDPELSKTIALMGDTPQKWLEAMDKWYTKVMDASSIDEVIDEAFAAEIARTPALAEVYGKLAEVNKGLWNDVRGTFFGNPARSRVERVMNSYLLYWPLSYQIKSTKWLVRVLFDRAGGVKTNSLGALGLDRLMEAHNRQLQEDPEYASFFEEHPTLVFAAQMLLPITWDSIGVSLSPPLRDVFFGRSKAIWDIGPIYTLTDFGPKLIGDLYPTLKDIPGLNIAYRGATGKVPKEGVLSPIDQLGDLDAIRFGQ